MDATGADSTEFGVSDGVISPDGTKVAFVTESSDLGLTDTNGVEDVYVRDLSTGETSLISVNETGTDSGDGRSVEPQFSADSARIAFRSSAGDLAPDAPDEANRRPYDVFVRDLSAGQTTQVALSTPADPDCWAYPCRKSVLRFEMSDDFERVVYESNEDVFHALFVHDLATGESGQIDHQDLWDYEDAVLSPDATKVAFTSIRDLAPEDTDGEPDVYIYDDVGTGTTSLVSVPGGSADRPWRSFGPTFSVDSTKVVFESTEPFDPLDTGFYDVYVRDLIATTTTLVSVNEAGTANGNGHSHAAGAGFTEDGSGVVFTSEADDLGPDDTNGASDVYLRDLTTGTTTLLSGNAAGTDSANGGSRLVLHARSASRVMFMSTADDLGPRDTNGAADLYAHDLASGVTTLVSADADGTDSGAGWQGSDPDPAASISADGRKVAFLTSADDFGPNDTNGQLDVYVAALRGADVAVSAAATPEPVASGGTLSYELDVSNFGPDPANDLVAGLLLPEGTEFVGVSTTAGSCEPPTVDAPRVVACTFGSPDVGHVANVTVDAVVTAPAGASLEAVALARSSMVDGAGDNNTAAIDSAVA